MTSVCCFLHSDGRTVKRRSVMSSNTVVYKSRMPVRPDNWILFNVYVSHPVVYIQSSKQAYFSQFNTYLLTYSMEQSPS